MHLVAEKGIPSFQRVFGSGVRGWRGWIRVSGEAKCGVFPMSQGFLGIQEGQAASPRSVLGTALPSSHSLRAGGSLPQPLCAKGESQKSKNWGIFLETRDDEGKNPQKRFISW